MRKVKVCLDAGHIGSTYNQSPVVKTYYESAMVWELHLKLKAALEQRGFEVMTTRATINTPMDVYARGAAAKGCDAFLSLHSNACNSESVDCSVSYYAYNKDDFLLFVFSFLKRLSGQQHLLSGNYHMQYVGT